tara:strand:+ start:361 stop:621 length:261 start_codon:yes stop_codon:yes gene_type:complete
MLLVDPVSKAGESPNTSTFYLPDDVTTANEFEVVSLIDASTESKFAELLSLDTQLVVEGHMLREIEVEGATYHLILENHVLGIVEP